MIMTWHATIFTNMPLITITKRCDIVSKPRDLPTIPVGKVSCQSTRRYDPQNIPFSEIGAVYIHCTYCTQYDFFVLALHEGQARRSHVHGSTSLARVASPLQVYYIAVSPQIHCTATCIVWYIFKLDILKFGLISFYDTNHQKNGAFPIKRKEECPGMSGRMTT